MALAQALDSVPEGVVVFSYGGCPYCRKLEQVLKKEGIPFAVLDYDADLDNGEVVREEIKRKHNHSSVPAVFVKGKFIGGCNDGPEPWMGATKMVKNGELQKLLG